MTIKNAQMMGMIIDELRIRAKEYEERANRFPTDSVITRGAKAFAKDYTEWADFLSAVPVDNSLPLYHTIGKK